MFMETALNNLWVLVIYTGAGLLVLKLTGSKLAPFSPWAVFGLHLINVIIAFSESASCLGVMPCLALVLPHAGLEITGLCLGCIAGCRMCRNLRPYGIVAAAVALVLAGAYVEAYVTPFPLARWL